MVDFLDLNWTNVPLVNTVVCVCGIGIVILSGHATIELNIVHAVVLPTTIAAMRLWVTIDALLLSKVDKVSTLDVVLTLHGCYS